MSILKLAENIVRMRHEKGVTQDELAAFMGVTKASVSKWETRQSCPDILLLPQLASFFNVTVDQLLGYEPQLRKEQIRRIYHRLAKRFEKEPFEEVMEESQKLVKEYYSCYPFLLQICVLWLNHAMLAKDQSRQKEILEEIAGLCRHILENSPNIGICNDAVGIKAMIDIQAGKAAEVIESLEEILNPRHLTGENKNVLIQAYIVTGEMEKADRYIQVNMFQNVLNLVGNGIQLLMVHGQHLELCRKVMERIDALIEVFTLEKLHPNSVANYYYQVAVTLCMHQKEEEAYQRLERFTELVVQLLEKGIILHGDDFFNQLDSWFEELELGAQGVRTGKIVAENAAHVLDNPVFAGMKQRERVEKLKSKLLIKGEEK